MANVSERTATRRPKLRVSPTASIVAEASPCRCDATGVAGSGDVIGVAAEGTSER
jgi:hypothetical protein